MRERDLFGFRMFLLQDKADISIRFFDFFGKYLEGKGVGRQLGLEPFEKGVTHSDVKPQNLLLNKDNNLKVLNFEQCFFPTKLIFE